MNNGQLGALRILKPEALDALAGADDWLAEESFLELVDPFEEELLDDLMLELPAPGSLLRLRELGSGFRRLDELFGSPELLETLGRIAGEKWLVHDFDYEFAGVHQTLARSPLRLSLGAHPRGWHRRLTILLCLDPAWTARSAEPQQASRCRLFIVPSDDWFTNFQLVPPEPPAEARCRLVTVHFYAQGEERRRPARATTAAQTPAEPPALFDRLRASRGDTMLVHGVVTAELTRQAFELQRLNGEVFQRLERYRDSLWQPCCDGTSPLSDEELRMFVRLPTLWEAALTNLSESFRVADEVAALAGGLPPPPLVGEALIDRQTGHWRDGWVGSLMLLRIIPKKPIRAITIEGLVPEPLKSSQRLFATVSECLHQLLPPLGDFVWRFAVTDSPDEPITLRITAARSWCPADDGSSPDGRALAWHLSKITVET